MVSTYWHGQELGGSWEATAVCYTAGLCTWPLSHRLLPCSCHRPALSTALSLCRRQGCCTGQFPWTCFRRGSSGPGPVPCLGLQSLFLSSWFILTGTVSKARLGFDLFPTRAQIQFHPSPPVHRGAPKGHPGQNHSCPFHVTLGQLSSANIWRAGPSKPME